MQLFYTPDISGDTYVLNEEESRHCSRVLRLGVGDGLYMTDGQGTLFKGEITSSSSKRCEVRIVERQREYGKRDYSLTMAVAPTKNNERYEWFLEKATEIGIDRVIPMECANSERRVVKRDRLEKIITSAVKQSLKAYHPQLDELTAFKDVVNMPFEGDRFIAHCRPSEDKRLLKDVAGRGRDVLVLTGPEGDFSEEEVALAKAAGFREVSLGETRLRVETAAIVICNTISILNQ